jgi:hypothetical protein
MRLFRSGEEKQQSAEAQAAFKQAVEVLNPSDPEWSRQVVAKLESDERLAALSKRERRKLGEQAFLRYADAALADDHLTEDEEDVLTGLAEVLGFEQSDFQQHDLYARLQVAKPFEQRGEGEAFIVRGGSGRHKLEMPIPVCAKSVRSARL